MRETLDKSKVWNPTKALIHNLHKWLFCGGPGNAPDWTRLKGSDGHAETNPFDINGITGRIGNICIGSKD